MFNNTSTDIFQGEKFLFISPTVKPTKKDTRKKITEITLYSKIKKLRH